MVEAYFAAINAHDYQTAWNLGGSNLDSSFSHFAAGFATTASDTVTVTGTSGPVVSIQLDALQTDGSTVQFAGTYTVQDGKIVSASIAETGSLPSSSSTSIPSRGEFCKYADLGKTTTDASGNTLTCVMESGRPHWH